MTASSTTVDQSPSASPAARVPLERSLPLERKLPLLILGILAVVLATSLAVSYYEIRRSAQLAAADRVGSLAQLLASMFQQSITNRAVIMRRAATDPAIIDALRAGGSAPSPAALKALTALTTTADSATPPQLVSAEGRPLGDVKLETPGDVQSVLNEIHHSPGADTAHVGRLFASKGHAALWITVPVKSDGRLLGYITQQRRIGNNPRALQPFRDLIGSDIELFLRNEGDSLSVDLAGAVIPAPKVRSLRPDVDIYDRGVRGQSVAASAPIRGTPLVVTLESPMRTVLARPLATMRTLAVIAMLLVVAGAVMAWLIGRRLTRPLVTLTSAVEAIAHGDYSERVDARGKDEIGRLGVAFNRMAERVQVASDASAEAVERLTKSGSRQQFLAEASQILAASVSDQSLLANLARMCVPLLADYCTIHVADDDGSIRRVTTVHYDVAKEETVRALVKRYEYRVDSPSEVAAVLRTRQPLLIPTLDPAVVRASAKDEATLRLLDEVGPTSFMCVPLVARGRAFGAMSFTMSDSGRSFRQDDLDLAMELSRRTAGAIDNAVIYRRSLALRLEAEAASNAKSDFLAKMSHEIRTPINAMMGYAELLEMGIAGPITEAQAKQLARIRSSGEHLTSLVDEILDLAKIEAGRMNVEPAVAVAGESAEGAVALIRPTAASKGVDLSGTIGGDPTVAYVGDPQRVQQILTNLLSNAVKFTPAGGSVSIQCGSGMPPGVGDGETEWTRICVHDTGVGIAPEDLERIFHPFVQVDNGYTRAHGGTGLGLTISRSLAQMMGGDIVVESVLGQGSQFTLWLPGATALSSH